MTYHGKIQGGVIVLNPPERLPEGAEVRVTLVPSIDRSGVESPIPPKGMTLSELGRWVETQPCDLPADLAANHDHYLHGLPKRVP